MLRVPRLLRKTELSILKWIALAAFVFSFATVQLANWWSMQSSAPLLNMVLVSIVVLLITFAVHTMIFRVVEQRERRLERRRAQDLAVSEERLRISREMHDGVAQVLAYCNAKLQAVSEFLVAGRTADAREQLQQLARTSRDMYADVREEILGLRTVHSEQEPLDAALRQYVELWQDQSGIPAHLVIDDRFALEPSEELQLVRIIQEALSNIRKHSRAQNASIEMTVAVDSLRVVVEDDGTGFEPGSIGRTRFPRFGLNTMRERAESIQAQLEVKSRLGHGTRIQLELPKPKSAEHLA